MKRGRIPLIGRWDFEISATVRRDSANLKRGEATSSEGFLCASVFRVGGGAAAMMRASRESWVWAVALDWLSLVGIPWSGLWTLALVGVRVDLIWCQFV